MLAFFSKIFTATVIAISALFGGHPSAVPLVPIVEQQESTSTQGTATQVVHSEQKPTEPNTATATESSSAAGVLPVKNQVPATVNDPQPAQTDSQQNPSEMCKEGYGKYATWSAALNSCTCVDGYDVSADGKTCVKIQSIQPVQQPDLSINQSACNTAVANLEKFQKQYAGLYAGSLSTGTSVVAQGNAANYEKQYNAELPVYQLVVEAACKIPATNQECQVSISKFNTMLTESYLGEGNGGFAYLQFPAYQTEIYYACQ